MTSIRLDSMYSNHRRSLSSAEKQQHTVPPSPHVPPPSSSVLSSSSSVINFPGSDVRLRTTTEPYTSFHLHSLTLRTTSGFFQDVLDLPQQQQQQSNALSVDSHSYSRSLIELPIDEDPMIAERLLCLLCGIPVPEWDDFDSFEQVVYLAEKWDTPGPLSYLRSTLVTPRFLENDDLILKIYGMACHFGWKSEAKVAASHTLQYSLFDPFYQEQLVQLPSRDLLALLKLHRARRDRLKQLLDDPALFNAGNGTSCSRTNCTAVIDNHPWRELKARLFLEVDRRPLGDTVVGVIELEEWPEAKRAWAAKCLICQKVLYDKADTIKNLRKCIQKLPMVI